MVDSDSKMVDSKMVDSDAVRECCHCSDEVLGVLEVCSSCNNENLCGKCGRQPIDYDYRCTCENDEHDAEMHQQIEDCNVNMENVLTKILITIEFINVTQHVKKDVIREQLVNFAELIKESIVANNKPELSNGNARMLYAKYVTNEQKANIIESQQIIDKVVEKNNIK